jgi:hypothetical protein
MPLLPLKCCELGSIPQLFFLPFFSLLDLYFSLSNSLKVCHGVFKDSKSNVIHGLQLLYKEGEQMVIVTWVFRPNTPLMHYESKRLPSVTNLDDACKEVGEKKLVFGGSVNTSCNQK